MVAQVIRLPQRAAEAAASAITRPVHPLLAPFMVDDWGRDQRFIDVVGPFARLRWRVMVGGVHHLPSRHGALLVVNDRQGSFSPLMAALALSRVTKRPVRFAGRPDIAPAGPLLRRLGGILARPDEVRCALAHGDLVIVSTTEQASRQAGTVDHRLIQPAVLEHTTILPVATLTHRVRRDARVEIGAPIRHSTKRKGPLAEVELADSTQSHLQRLLDGFGGF